MGIALQGGLALQFVPSHGFGGESMTLSGRLILVVGLSCGTWAMAQPSPKVYIAQGKWSQEVDLNGPAGETVQMRKGRTYVNGKEMLVGQLTPAQLQELENDSYECLKLEDIPTVAQYIDEMVRPFGGDGSDAVKNARVTEATSRAARFEYEFTTTVLSRTPYSGATVCTAKFELSFAETQCEVTWRTPPHAGKKSRFLMRGVRVGSC